MGKWMLAGQLHAAVGADDQKPGVEQLLGHKLQQQQRRMVGPMKVVQDQY